MAGHKIPIIDISQDDETIGKLLYDACSTIGAFYIINHGISKSFVDAYFSMMRAMFDLPLEEKLKLHADSSARGYSPLFKETLSKGQAKGDIKEGFIVGREDLPGTDAAKLPLHGPNKWFDDAVLPGFKKATEEYQAAMTALATRLLGYLEIALGVPKDFFVRGFDCPFALLKLVRYHAEASNPSKGLYAAGPHRDYGVATIIATNEVPGLQVEYEGSWIDVPPIPEAFMIVTGDLLKRWTNDKFTSVLHRVVKTRETDRYSTGFFYEPTYETLVEVIPKCCEGQPPKYPPITAGQHVAERLLASEGHSFAGGLPEQIDSLRLDNAA